MSVIKIFDHYFHKQTILRILLDLVWTVGALVAAIFLHSASSSLQSPVAWTTGILLIVGIFAINASLGFYQRSYARRPSQTRARAALSLCLSIPLAYLLFRISPIQMLDGLLFLVMFAAGLALMLMHRVHALHNAPSDMMRQRVLIFGTGTRARMVGQSLTQSDPHVDVVGYYASPSDTVLDASGNPLLARGKSLTEVVAEYQIDEIVVALSERRGGSMPLRELLDCKLNGVSVLDIATHFEKTLGQIRLDSVSAGWLVFGDGFGHGVVRAAVKRVFDIVCASILIVLSFPVMLVTALFIELESSGPILYRQERVGLAGLPFNVVKFRSMRTDAEKDGKPRWASATDDRVTRVGAVIRKLRIDELPQLFCVLGGSMSLVGPRPERPYFVEQLTREIPYFAVRQSVKPGVTGWAQVRYQYGASVEDAMEKLQYDLYYVKNHTLFLDLVVLFETVGVVLMRKGAQ